MYETKFMRRVLELAQRGMDTGHGGPFGHRTGPAADITAWVEKTFTKMDVGGATVYDLQSKV